MFKLPALPAVMSHLNPFGLVVSLLMNSVEVWWVNLAATTILGITWSQVFTNIRHESKKCHFCHILLVKACSRAMPNWSSEKMNSYLNERSDKDTLGNGVYNSRILTLFDILASLVHNFSSLYFCAIDSLVIFIFYSTNSLLSSNCPKQVLWDFSTYYQSIINIQKCANISSIYILMNFYRPPTTL